MKYKITLNGKNYEVEVEKGEAVLLGVSDASAFVPAPAPAAAPAAAAPAAPAQAPASAPAAPSVPGTGTAVPSPMPGNIIKVNVAAGDKVSKGQVLLILEAMKMENDIQAAADGVVTGVAVAKGDTVDTGSPLLYLA